ncbi:uncharacterized protein MAM_00442 [Metarhizium album ARSEF 1941]|uniref:F-box domain-containing protein n=1 Tax=Metarhizium album (strain ARSEF 1941) TaxID=1081103 RepID=A0A0B2X819_METAS|nr:uncharacterized protein MAM_00442 [Metarhizium album ARSEF 1941]KHO01441.1 hypothetical protein MAM_00442 [Metarhizium album ARSEF 1941]
MSLITTAMSSNKSGKGTSTELCLASAKSGFPETDFIIPSNMIDKDALITATLLYLPPELTLRILEEMDNDVDRMCLGLSCRRLLQIVNQSKLRLPCMKASRKVRNIHQDNKLAFSMLKRVYPLGPSGNPRTDAALCESCFKWMSMNHHLSSTRSIVLSEVRVCWDKRLDLAGIFFECAACRMRDGAPSMERLRRQKISTLSAVLDPASFCSAPVWTSRVNMHNGSEVDP